MHRTLTRTLALTTAAAVVATPVALLTGGPASADGPERHARGSVAGASFEISAEKDDGGFEVDADLDGVAAGSTWRMVVRHDGTRVSTQRAGAVRDDGRYEVDFRGVHRRDTAGQDTFKVTLKRLDGTGKVTRTLTLR